MLNKRGKIAVGILITFTLFLIFLIWFSFTNVNITGNVLERTGKDCIKNGGNDTRYAGIAKINNIDFPDKCIDSSTLKEYYCSENNQSLYYDLIKCPCREGICTPEIECVEGKNKLLTIYEKGEVKFQFQDVCISRNNQSLLVKHRCSNFESYDVEENLNWNKAETLVKTEELCYLNDQYCDPYELTCKYKLGISTEPKLSVFPPKINLEKEQEKSITITLIDTAISKDVQVLDIFVSIPGQDKTINKALYYENDGLYRATYKIINNECLKQNNCNPNTIPISSGEVVISYNSKTGKSYTTSFNVARHQEETVSNQPVVEQNIPESMELNEIKTSLTILNNLESNFIIKGTKNISESEIEIGKSKEANKINTNLFSLKVLTFNNEINAECNNICSKFDNSTSIIEQKINNFKDIKTNTELQMNDLCSCKCTPTDLIIKCRELTRRAMRKVYN